MTTHRWDAESEKENGGAVKETPEVRAKKYYEEILGEKGVGSGQGMDTQSKSAHKEHVGGRSEGVMREVVSESNLQQLPAAYLRGRERVSLRCGSREF